ncbi:hypothetical protein M378DRAFT_163588, partial [Amanita muscaria Koide BX008]
IIIVSFHPTSCFMLHTIATYWPISARAVLQRIHAAFGSGDVPRANDVCETILRTGGQRLTGSCLGGVFTCL